MTPLSADPLTPWSFGLSAVALIVAIGSAVANVVLWQRSGAVVRVSGMLATVVGLKEHSGQKVLLTVRNRGRAYAWVEQWGFLVEAGRHTVPGEWSHGPDLPHELVSGRRATWLLDWDEARRGLARDYPNPRHRWDVVPFVRLGDDERMIKGTAIRIWETQYVGGGPPPWWKRLVGRTEILLRFNGTQWEQVDR